MIVLGIESSCDETSVAIIKDDQLKANLISSQDFHSLYGGVVPELSSRAHLQMIIPLVKQALQKSEIKLNDVDLFSATAGPGLVGALLVGLTFAKGLAFSLRKEFVPVNHIEGHIYSGFLMESKPEFPILTLVVSGGHTLLLLVESHTKIYKLGSTVDDAVGEAFDKVSKMLGFGYPGGPKIQSAAKNGVNDEINYPIAELKNEFDFSFSGLKTSVLRYIEKHYKKDEIIPEQELAMISYSFQEAAVGALIAKTQRALKKFNVNTLSVVGGVAANQLLRKKFAGLAESYSKKLVIPDLIYCGDNAAMIAYRAQKVFENGQRFNLNVSPYPSLPVNAFSVFTG
ncbi:MAG: tRNA (adenosine(37)-N6)-threonylcarbamoyltransferase complex transferase subunit TsaD [Ignavibacteriales bacterium]|nr:MAG: tRNA (adenosine(37)-N6)-threonylcarbamoyltransferase complex transferase subunit TsaD [Ignavibacteriales bacterium]